MEERVEDDAPDVDFRGREGRAWGRVLRFSRLFGNSPEFWLNVQLAVDLWQAAKSIKDTINHSIPPLSAA